MPEFTPAPWQEPPFHVQPARTQQPLLYMPLHAMVELPAEKHQPEFGMVVSHVCTAGCQAQPTAENASHAAWLPLKPSQYTLGTPVDTQALPWSLQLDAWPQQALEIPLQSENGIAPPLQVPVPGADAPHIGGGGIQPHELVGGSNFLQPCSLSLKL